MSDMKYNFSEIGSHTDPLGGMLVFLNGNHHALFYAIITLIFFVTLYVFIKKTQDIAKSSLYSLHIITILSLVLMYWGLKLNAIFLPEVFVLSLIVIEMIGIPALYYTRSKGL